MAQRPLKRALLKRQQRGEFGQSVLHSCDHYSRGKDFVTPKLFIVFDRLRNNADIVLMNLAR